MRKQFGAQWCSFSMKSAKLQHITCWRKLQIFFSVFEKSSLASLISVNYRNVGKFVTVCVIKSSVAIIRLLVCVVSEFGPEPLFAINLFYLLSYVFILCSTFETRFCVFVFFIVVPSNFRSLVLLVTYWFWFSWETFRFVIFEFIECQGMTIHILATVESYVFLKVIWDAFAAQQMYPKCLW